MTSFADERKRKKKTHNHTQQLSLRMFQEFNVEKICGW